MNYTSIATHTSTPMIMAMFPTRARTDTDRQDKKGSSVGRNDPSQSEMTLTSASAACHLTLHIAPAVY